MADGFLGRWSRRKLDAKAGRPIEEDPPAPASGLPAAAAGAAQLASSGADNAMEARTSGGDVVSAQARAAPAPPDPPPTMADVEALTPESDFSRFTGAQVAPEVKNAAMKKLFADPHFNVMDGLDIYIDDYGKPDPIPQGMLKQLASAKFLGLFDDNGKSKESRGAPQENPEAPRREADPATRSDLSAQEAPQFVAQSGPPEPAPLAAPSQDADPDLRLQQDPAPGPQGTGRGAQ